MADTEQRRQQLKVRQKERDHRDFVKNVEGLTAPI
jgi:hypothetical protein